MYTYCPTLSLTDGVPIVHGLEETRRFQHALADWICRWGACARDRGFCSFVFPLAAKAAPQELNDHGGFLGGGRRRRPMMKNAYTHLALQTLVGGIIMFLVMFVMIDRQIGIASCGERVV